MFRRRTISLNAVDNENPFLLSFSDLMGCLLAIFILVLIVMLVELENRRDELRLSKQELIQNLEEIQKVQSSVVRSINDISQREHSLALMLTEIQKELKTQGIEVVIAENGTVLRIPERQLTFDRGKYAIPSSCTGLANRIGDALLQALQNNVNRSMLDTVFIEGHTDSVPNYREMGNWGLSTYRAISLWNYWTEDPGRLVELKSLQTIPQDPSQDPKPLISASGYADTRSTHGPLAGQGLSDDRPEDRRIDIRFTLAASEKKDLEGLRENLKQMSEKTNALIRKLRAVNHAH